MNAVEIERKFLVETLPGSLDRGVGKAIRQGYIAADGVRTVRIRQKGERYFLTVKDGAGLTRGEVETELEASQFETLWPLTDKRRVEKVRYLLSLPGELTAELDIFDGALAGLVVVEVEFESEDRARAFRAPDWFGRDVTEEAGWSNFALAEHGLPD